MGVGLDSSSVLYGECTASVPGPMVIEYHRFVNLLDLEEATGLPPFLRRYVLQALEFVTFF
jgi:hypothetical protein